MQYDVHTGAQRQRNPPWTQVVVFIPRELDFQKEQSDISSVLQTHFLVQHNPTLSCHITSGHVKQSSPIIMYRYLAGANIIKPFMLSVQCVLNLCPEVSPRGLAQMEE